MAYIESGFVDKKPALEPPTDVDEAIDIVPVSDYLAGKGPKAKTRFRKTVMSAPRPRRAKDPKRPSKLNNEVQNAWEALPRNVEFLIKFFDDSVTANYYRGEFRESREELIQRLLDPELSLEETSRLLGVCPATVRRYTNRGWLPHHRTQGGQRRFRLSAVVNFVETHGRHPES